MSEEETVFIIDDDASIRRSLTLFLGANNYQVESYGSSEEYLAREEFSGTGCLVLDVNLEGKTGFDLQEELAALNSHLPIIFITGRGNIHMSVVALKKGAVNFLEKPFEDDELLQSINEALAMSRKLRIEKDEIQKAKQLIKTLTLRESEILKYVITGMLNKQIASELQIAEQTVKLHRQSICEKLGVKSVPQIIKIAEKAVILK
jgi:FixJ family two-component response regulator